ncbi:HAD-IIA family hydrolase [Photobacterium sanguinicancri]|uniref:HAD-IIA family hydrolase n=1 Tax=Photobacterium sanguinicancri TaxID=875932 RepID=UPI0021C3DA84|nr:HAD hydrolase-like protein [Photobacterium sanguinicancri]
MIFSHAFFDLDGTIYVDGKLISGIYNSLHKLKSSGTEIYYMTNNTSVSLSKYYEKLLLLDLPIHKNCVISPTITLSHWLTGKNVKKFFSVGTDDFINEVCLLSDVEHDENQPEVVVVAFDRELTYKKLQQACCLINRGVPWVITHIDLACPSEQGPIPDCGSIAKVISFTTGIEPIKDFGKPSEEMTSLIRKLSTNSKSILVAGDRSYTDAQIGINLGAETVLVCTGEYERGQDMKLELLDVKVEDTLSVYLDKVLVND